MNKYPRSLALDWSPDSIWSPESRRVSRVSEKVSQLLWNLTNEQTIVTGRSCLCQSLKISFIVRRTLTPRLRGHDECCADIFPSSPVSFYLIVSYFTGDWHRQSARNLSHFHSMFFALHFLLNFFCFSSFWWHLKLVDVEYYMFLMIIKIETRPNPK